MSEKKRKVLTLCIALSDGKILLALKKRGFGSGRWNGFGGKVEEGETIEKSAIRETKEEGCIEIEKMEKYALHEFEFVGDPVLLEVHVFKILAFSGTPTETEEMAPRWFDFDDIPYETMWPDDRHWLPLFIEGKKTVNRFLFDTSSGTERIVEKSVQVVPKL
ncbi:MAG: hypothetical protein A2836_03405 [Candidatus Taylorbacteria bacterium RIFCSPHIGHO2_01_FULL_45_63]|uniref:Oxidized purine nucleoside triphosphate hydrolase n=1 Tax=Candidatus Taylorbacteria bacterium RIFCSPHIGHO2_02_FULL_45_35 TaxID=1802311 RepID=A0A1G2MPE1_9BACT|nr:MAG: hypothetical protein A2836_03405 [Candidatus Taylorbacteria bacterium RIFCSPHIGHO2_01_FULL_45_63]OHA25755.1 MAG: hypothetical protein A3D56_02370 [Candidatus Taylorbacteria bacterium RIFCSPHIGHO2_02_FULL_45_35]OHA34103.1 MAG: hypothetical protein A3A22_02455 [Candidatus Taylorbacteria bacterium RIFCSPLOWO2_01_FULL_45_34b]